MLWSSQMSFNRKYPFDVADQRCCFARYHGELWRQSGRWSARQRRLNSVSSDAALAVAASLKEFLHRFLSLRVALRPFFVVSGRPFTLVVLCSDASTYLGPDLRRLDVMKFCVWYDTQKALLVELRSEIKLQQLQMNDSLLQNQFIQFIWLMWLFLWK